MIRKIVFLNTCNLELWNKIVCNICIEETLRSMALWVEGVQVITCEQQVPTRTTLHKGGGLGLKITLPQILTWPIRHATRHTVVDTNMPAACQLKKPSLPCHATREAAWSKIPVNYAAHQMKLTSRSMPLTPCLSPSFSRNYWQKNINVLRHRQEERGEPKRTLSRSKAPVSCSFFHLLGNLMNTLTSSPSRPFSPPFLFSCIARHVPGGPKILSVFTALFIPLYLFLIVLWIKGQIYLSRVVPSHPCFA